ncbi:phosphate signaling complex protein PhoU [Periweissella cryptocerci]|uniref:Phosphate-specific transport system accessory protein PhoU n=1 Tax=Periweissella cryptocerci TaxID=2506420 RepID=A0A4P6YT91_9LACO|nr:phosphate signaling complex protein PhoU [Periweissella cryptocerci]QBO35896.1 phosphate signaling complex protein PhoU [Periweissella cryptocerci]
MRRLFDEELADLDASFTEMGMLVSETIGKSVTAFVNHDRETAQLIIKEDEQINSREVAIEKKTFEMIALYQPVTIDLREIVTVLKAVSELERMGDHARDIATATIRVKGTKRMANIEENIANMGEITRQMVKDILGVYVNDDALGATSVAERDAQVAEMSDQVRLDVIKSIEQDSELATSGTDYLLVAGHLKRIADYVTNIAEWIVYKRTGKIVDLNPGGSTL